jgi:hypothetical protein
MTKDIIKVMARRDYKESKVIIQAEQEKKLEMYYVGKF